MFWENAYCDAVEPVGPLQKHSLEQLRGGIKVWYTLQEHITLSYGLKYLLSVREIHNVIMFQSVALFSSLLSFDE